MKFSLVHVSMMALFSLAVTASPLEKRAQDASNTTTDAAATSDSMHGAKATASISIIGSEDHSSAGNALSYASISVIVPATIAAVLSLA
jgi:hypothetical protein